MIDASLENLFQFAQSTSGRRLHALMKMREVAVKYGLRVIVERIDLALADDRETRALDNRWEAARGQPVYAEEVPEIDNWVDQLLKHFRDTVLGYTKEAFRGTALCRHAERILATVFPNKLAAITSLPYVEQVAAVEVILGDLQNSLAADVAALGVGLLVDRLAELTAMYRQAVNKGRDDLQFAEVVSARKRGQGNMLEVVAMIVGQYPSRTDLVHVSRRAELLEPILEQDRQVRAYRSKRRSVPDIDPDAGGEAAAAEGGEVAEAGDEEPGDEEPGDE